MRSTRRNNLRPTRLALADVARLGATGLRTRPLRTVLAAAGIAIGVAAMVAIVGISSSGGAEIQRRIESLGPNLLHVTGAHRAQGEGLATLPRTTRTSIARIGPVLAASATASLPFSAYRNDHVPAGETGSLAVLAADPTLLGTLHADVAFGSWFTTASARYPSVVLGSAAAQRLGIDRLGADVVVGAELVPVVGVLDPVPLAPEIDTSVLMGWETARSHYRFAGHPTSVYVRVVQDQLDAVGTIIPRSVSPTAPETIAVGIPSDAIAAGQAATATTSGLLIGLAGVALVIGGIGIANTMIVSVLERRPEVGLRRALGATRGQVRVQFLSEAILLSVLGGVTGCVCGSVVTTVYAQIQGWPVVVPLWVSSTGVGVTVLVGAVSGFYPAMRASRISPTAALAAL
ncbi:ABC transporter permease [Kineosporia sp. J2-2]|uniref:ABC transporter permease n=1 Tax=Kineosporia corallincola TaxID=2835133 RepID=A0ABS5TC60_9ACTN|nr:ABC transporter permease [Kineosporia corallincola]MBT0768428.1 ABC transporter permease [Kineosporia corallincola]